MQKPIIFLVAILIAGSSGFLLQQFINKKNKGTPPPVSSAVIGKPAQPFSMYDLEGKLRTISEWQGKVVLLNFWATWCPPCLKEIPDFIDLQNKYKNADFQIVGIAIDEIEDIKTFNKEMKMNYPILPSQTEALELAQRYGNSYGALPYSVFINRKGEVTHTFMGELSKIKAEEILKSFNLSP